MPSPRSPDLVGRDAELRQLSSRLGIGDSPRSSGFVLLGGDAGLGKTRLLTELSDLAVAEGWQVVAGHCLDLADGSLSYLPFSEILGRLMADDEQVTADVTGRHPTLARLQPGRRVRNAQGEDAGSSLEQGDLFIAMHDLFESVAEARPLLVVVEDAHWADQSTRDMLSFLFSRPFAGRVSIVVSFRSDDLHRRHPLRPQIAQWSRLREVSRIQLEPLDDLDVRLLIRALRPGTMAEDDFAAIVGRADGNPFFVEELVGAAQLGELPAELADVLLVRLDTFDEATLHVVRLVSVAGREVSHALLSAVSDLSPTDLDAAVRTAVEQHVLVTGQSDTYAFRHALQGEAVYDDLMPGERVRLHRAFVAAMVSGGAAGTAAELAQHARRAGDLPTALRADIEAGNAAMSVGGAIEGATHFLEALEILETLDHRPDDVDETLLVRRCADAFVSAGRVARAVKVLRRRLDVMTDDDPASERGQLLTAMARALMLTDTTEDPLRSAEEATQVLRDGPPPLLARALAAKAAALGRWNAEDARSVAMEAMEIAETHNLVDVVVDLTTTLAALDDEATADQLREAWSRARHQAREQGLVEPEMRASYFLARVHHDRGEISQALHYYRYVMARGQETGLQWSPYPAESRALTAALLQAQGRLGEAYDLLDVTGQRPPMVYEWLYYAQQTNLWVLSGHRITDAFEQIKPHWSSDGLIAIHAGSAEMRLAERLGDHARAHATYDRIVATVGPLWHEWFAARLRLSTMAVAAYSSAAPDQSAEERATSAEATRRLLADGGRVIERYAGLDDTLGPEYHAWVRRREAEGLRWRWLAQIDPPEEGVLLAAWRDTVTAFEDFGSRPELAEVRVRLAEVLRATGDSAGARELADQVRVEAKEMGLEPLLAEITRLGSTAPRAAPSSSSPASLTPRESEILALVAAGRSNGEIARQLFIATKTVSVHVSNLMGKLDATSRTEAAAIARRRGLL